MKQQITSFDRTECYDSIKGTFKRGIIPNNLLNLSIASTANTTTGNITLTSTVVSTSEEVYVYAINSFSPDSATAGALYLAVDGTAKYYFNKTANLNLSRPDAPLLMVREGSTLSIVAASLTTTSHTFNVSVVGKIEPIPTSVEPLS